MEKVNLSQKFELFTEHWSPKIVGELNGQHVKLAKFQGEFVWHKHDHEDELFFVVKGTLHIELRDKTVEIGENEFFIVPRGVEPACREGRSLGDALRTGLYTKYRRCGIRTHQIQAGSDLEI